MRSLIKKKYIIRLSAEERQNLTDLVRKGKAASYHRTHAQILLFTDEGELGPRLQEDEVAFTWSTSRGHRHAVEQLKGFSGTLLTDGYSAYEKAVAALNEQEVLVTHAACWAHGRRALEKALAIHLAACRASIRTPAWSMCCSASDYIRLPRLKH